MGVERLGRGDEAGSVRASIWVRKAFKEAQLLAQTSSEPCGVEGKFAAPSEGVDEADLDPSDEAVGPSYRVMFVHMRNNRLQAASRTFQGRDLVTYRAKKAGSAKAAERAAA